MRPAWGPTAAAAVATTSVWATSVHPQLELPTALENYSSTFLPTEISWNQSSTYNSTRGLGTTSGRNLVTTGGGFDEEADLWQAMRVVAGVVAILLCFSIAGAAFHRRHKLQRRIEEMRKRYHPPTIEILEAESKGRLHPPTSPRATASLDRRIRNWIANVPYGRGSAASAAASIQSIAGRVPTILEDAEFVFVRAAPSPAPLSPSPEPLSLSPTPLPPSSTPLSPPPTPRSSSPPPQSPTETQDSLPQEQPLDTRNLVIDAATDASLRPSFNALCTLPWVGRYGRSEVRT